MAAARNRDFYQLSLESFTRLIWHDYETIYDIIEGRNYRGIAIAKDKFITETDEITKWYRHLNSLPEKFLIAC